MLRLAPALLLVLGACLFDGRGEAEVRRPDVDAGAPESPRPDAGADRPDAGAPGGNEDDEGDNQDDEVDEDDDGDEELGNGGGGDVCEDDEDCDSGECDSVGGGVKQCLEACQVDADCPAGFECDDGACDD
jgi:hypothetical protein